MNKSEYFKKEIEFIESEDLRVIVKYYLDNYVPSYFWECGASSSGKFHPAMSQGNGGTVRHTKAVCLFNEELLKMSPYCYLKDEHKDFTRVACICHDTVKYGVDEYDKNEYANHALNASLLFAECWKEVTCGNEAPEYLLSAIRAHMGQWSTNRDDRPFTNIDRCVHMADYMASRSFIDIPCVNEEYLEVYLKEMTENEEDDEPVEDCDHCCEKCQWYRPQAEEDEDWCTCPDC